MLGGSTSRLARLGSNFVKVISDIFFSSAGGISLPVKYISLVNSTAVIRVSCFNPI